MCCARGGATRSISPARIRDARPAPMDSPQENFRARLEALGFDDVRFAAVAKPPTPPLRDWLAAGHHADMDWMERTTEKRLDPQLVLPGAQSIVMLGVTYWSGKFENRKPKIENPDRKSVV